jgi:Tfp pilus assembly protein PilO
MKLGWKVSASLLLVTSIVSGLGYWYYKDSQATIKMLTENNAKLELAVEINETTIRAMQEDTVRQAETLTAINKDFQDIRSQNKILADKLSEHTIGFLAEKKPALLEKIVNNATKNANRCLSS